MIIFETYVLVCFAWWIFKNNSFYLIQWWNLAVIVILNCNLQCASLLLRHMTGILHALIIQINRNKTKGQDVKVQLALKDIITQTGNECQQKKKQVVFFFIKLCNVTTTVEIWTELVLTESSDPLQCEQAWWQNSMDRPIGCSPATRKHISTGLNCNLINSDFAKSQR